MLRDCRQSHLLYDTFKTMTDSSAQKMARKILSNLISPNLRKKINWTKKPGKIEVRQFNMNDVVARAVKTKFPKTGKKAVMEAIRTWINNKTYVYK